MPEDTPAIHALPHAEAALATARELVDRAVRRVLVHGHADVLDALRTPLRAAGTRGCRVRVLTHAPVAGCGGEMFLVPGDPGPARAFWLQVVVDDDLWLAADAGGGAPAGAWGRQRGLAASLARVLDTLRQAGGLRCEIAGAAHADPGAPVTFTYRPRRAP